MLYTLDELSRAGLYWKCKIFRLPQLIRGTLAHSFVNQTHNNKWQAFAYVCLFVFYFFFNFSIILFFVLLHSTKINVYISELALQRLPPRYRYMRPPFTLLYDHAPTVWYASVLTWWMHQFNQFSTCFIFVYTESIGFTLHEEYVIDC